VDEADLLLGVRLRELAMHPALKKAKGSFKLGSIKASDRTLRTAVAVRLPLAAHRFVQFKPDPNDTETSAAGGQNRVGCDVPPLSRKHKRALEKYTLRFCKKFFKPLAPDTDVSVEAWLAKCPYPAWRKDELQQLWNERKGKALQRDYKVKAFIKDEFYPEVKHSRMINSRSDMFKCMVGPVFRAMEAEIFKHPAFIKKIPVKDRPAYVKEYLEQLGAKYGAGDFTAFESHFTKDRMESI
jgi:hypothetical protein